MRLVSGFLPDEFPYHPNWKAGETHPAVASRSAVPAKTDWDGLTRYYRALWELAGSPTSADHSLWVRLLG